MTTRDPNHELDPGTQVDHRPGAGTNDPAAYLPAQNAASTELDESWSGDNEQWWDWYVSLAHDDGQSQGGPARELPPLPRLPLPDLELLEAELREPYVLTPAQIERFRSVGYVKLPGVVSPAALLALREELLELLAGTSTQARFLSADMMWTARPISRAFVLSPRLAGIAAELLGVSALRLYHDSALCKLPACGRTPWHYDAHHFPIVTEDIISLWMPLQPTPREMGPLALAPGLELWRQFEALPFSKFDDSYDRTIVETLRARGLAIDDGAFALGALSFHHGNTLHSAGANHTSSARVALSTTYFGDGARLTEAPTMISGDYEKYMPGVGRGERIDSALNPVLWRAG